MKSAKDICKSHDITEAFDFCMTHYCCSAEEIEQARKSAKADPKGAERCYKAIFRSHHVDVAELRAKRRGQT